METSSYLIEHEVFKGPVNLLLDFVRKRKVDVFEIKIIDIIKDFLNYLSINREACLEERSSFLYIVSILLEIKSSSVIPSQSRPKPDDEIPEISRELLLERERNYRIFAKVSNYFERLKETESLYYLREAQIERQFLEVFPDFLKDLNADNINKIASRLLKKVDDIGSMQIFYIDDATITVPETMELIKKIINFRNEITFKEIADKYTLIVDKIICFLSILELYKNEEIDIVQFENFGNIIIKNY